MRVTEYVLASQDDHPPVQRVLLLEVLVPFSKDLAEMLGVIYSPSHVSL